MFCLHKTSSKCTLMSALLPVVALAAGVPALASVHLPVPHESFLNYHAANIYQLSQEVTFDPQVRTRLANHFHISEAQMTAYIRRNLVLTHLQKTGVYKVACVRQDGSEYWVESRLPAGTPVFASRVTGQPILKLACGNPMVSALPPALLQNKPLGSPQLASVPVTLADADIVAAPVTTLIDGTQSDLVTPDDTLAPAVVQVSPSLQFLGSSGVPNLFPALLGLGGAVAVFGHGGSHSGGSGTPVTPPPPAVPEASTVLSLGLLLLGSSAVLIKRRKVADTIS